jgi:hypothetical protein
LKDLEERIGLIKRLKKFHAGEDLAEYSGLGGAATSWSDRWTYAKRYGYTMPNEDALALEEQRQAQAQSTVVLGVRASEQASRLKKKKSDLLSQAGDESAQAENLNQEINQDRKFAMDRDLTQQGTAAIDAGANALGQMHAAEDNNTAQGRRDAVAALNAGNAAAARVNQAMKTVGDSNKELHAALQKTLADLAAENRQLSARLAQQNFNSK